jgi:dTDP-4-dehydrorhamnose reductase
MRWIVTGSGGQLGQSLVRQLREVLSPAEVLACTRSEVDLSDLAGLGERVKAWELGPGDVVANAAAHTGVDACESELDAAMAINAHGPEVLAAACAGAGARFVHVSTDYVFDGRGEAPYAEDYPTEPNTAYGRTKLVGEQRVMAVDPEALIARTSWVFGPGKNFVAAILRQARLRRTGEVEGPLSVVDDQQGCPTYAADLAAALRALVAKEAHGIFHVSNRGATTWWDFARAILDETGYSDLVIERGRTAILNLPAERPAYSVLDCSRAASLGVTLRSWEEALREYLESEDSPALVGVSES